MRFATEGGTYDVVYRSKVNGVYCIIHATGEHIYAEDGTRLAIIWYVNEGEYAPDRDSGLNGMLAQRLREEGMLRRELAVPVYGGELALCVADVTGRSFYYALERK